MEESIPDLLSEDKKGDYLSATNIIKDAEALYRSANYADAAAVLAPLVTTQSPAPAALRLLGLCHLHRGNIPEAIGCLNQACVLAPIDLQIRLDYGAALHAGGHFREAIELVRTCQALLPRDPAPMLHLSRSLVAVGDVAAGIRAARKARMLAPALAACEYTLGMAYLAGSFHTRAIACLATATKIEPGFVAAWVNLAVAYYEVGKLSPAIDAVRKALALEPTNEAATINLALYRALAGFTQTSERLLRDLLAVNPEAAEARINLASNLLHEDRNEEVVVLLEGLAPPTSPTRQKWQVLRLLALANLGRFDEVRRLLPALKMISPELQSKLRLSRALQALHDGDTDQALQEAAALTSLLDGADQMKSSYRAFSHYDLAAIWSRLDRRDQAFANWTRAHRQLARSQPFSRTAYADFVDATIDTFSTERMQLGPSAGNRDQLPVFIVGMPRSGTTLVEQILASHAAVHGAGERGALGQLFRQIGGAEETAAAVQRVGSLDGQALDTHAAAYLAVLRALAPEASRISDKLPGNFRHLGLAGLLLPGARVIACERDPRDVGLSIFMRNFNGSHGYSHDLADLGWYIGQQRRLMTHWRAVLPNSILTVRHEALVANMPVVLRELLAFLGLDYDARCERFHETEREVQTASRSQVREPINARGMGRWRLYERELEPLIAALRKAGALEEKPGHL